LPLTIPLNGAAVVGVSASQASGLELAVNVTVPRPAFDAVTVIVPVWVQPVDSCLWKKFPVQVPSKPTAAAGTAIAMAQTRMHERRKTKARVAMVDPPD
jgi:hypothetical protein